METLYDKICNLVTGMPELDIKTELQNILKLENYSSIYLFLSTFYFHYSTTYINSIGYQIEDINKFLDVFYQYVTKKFNIDSLETISLVYEKIQKYFEIFVECYSNTNDLSSYFYLISELFYNLIQDENNIDISTTCVSKNYFNLLFLLKTSIIEKSILAFLHNN